MMPITSPEPHLDDCDLFSPFSIRDIHFKNRIAVSPMCQYSSENGFANDWHLVHLGSRAMGGAALVMTEAAAVTPTGRITPYDLGIWSDDHIEFLARITQFIKAHDAVAGLQLAHAGRKASTERPWSLTKKLNANETWQPVAPSAIPFNKESMIPHALNKTEINDIIKSFADAALRAKCAGFDVIEIHAAHGYLLHEFLSPLSNHRQDEYGQTFENRMRFLLEVVSAVRKVWPDHLPLFVRVSATDWLEGGIIIDDTIRLSKALKSYGVDLIDTSSGGILFSPSIPVGPGYQTIFAEKIRCEAKIKTGAVGLITTPAQADHIIRTHQADMVFLARELLRDPYWPLKAAYELRQKIKWPDQYLRAEPSYS